MSLNTSLHAPLALASHISHAEKFRREQRPPDLDTPDTIGWSKSQEGSVAAYGATAVPRPGFEQRRSQPDRLGEDLGVIDRKPGESISEGARSHQLLSIAGIDATAAIGLLTAIGDVGRLRSPQKLVSYFGHNPHMYESGLQRARHGHISKLALPCRRGQEPQHVIPGPRSGTRNPELDL